MKALPGQPTPLADFNLEIYFPRVGRAGASEEKLGLYQRLPKVEASSKHALGPAKLDGSETRALLSAH